MNYSAFVEGKLLAVPPVGITNPGELMPGLFPHQRDLVNWALRRGRAAIFADTGLGKTRMHVAPGHTRLPGDNARTWRDG